MHVYSLEHNTKISMRRNYKHLEFGHQQDQQKQIMQVASLHKSALCSKYYYIPINLILATTYVYS